MVLTLSSVFSVCGGIHSQVSSLPSSYNPGISSTSSLATETDPKRRKTRPLRSGGGRLRGTSRSRASRRGSILSSSTFSLYSSGSLVFASVSVNDPCLRVDRLIPSRELFISRSPSSPVFRRLIPRSISNPFSVPGEVASARVRFKVTIGVKEEEVLPLSAGVVLAVSGKRSSNHFSE